MKHTHITEWAGKPGEVLVNGKPLKVYRMSFTEDVPDGAKLFEPIILKVKLKPIKNENGSRD